MTLGPFGCRVTAIGVHISTYGTQMVRRGQVFQGAREEEGWWITVASSPPGDNKHIVQMRLYKHTSKSLSDHILQQSQNSHHLHKLFRLSKGANISTSCFQDNLKGLIRSWGKGVDQYTNFQSSLCPEYLCYTWECRRLSDLRFCVLIFNQQGAGCFLFFFSSWLTNNTTIWN